MKEWSIVNAVNWTRKELIPHLAKRNAAGVTDRKFAKDLGVTVNVIFVQATHLQETPGSLVNEAQRLRDDLKKMDVR